MSFCCRQDGAVSQIGRWLACLAVVGCSRGKDSTGVDSTHGIVSFWTDDESCGRIPHEFCVELDGVDGRACAGPQAGVPRCGDTRASASFSLSEGTYGFEAVIVAGELVGGWDGTVSVEAESCALVELPCS